MKQWLLHNRLWGAKGCKRCIFFFLLLLLAALESLKWDEACRSVILSLEKWTSEDPALELGHSQRLIRVCELQAEKGTGNALTLMCVINLILTPLSQNLSSLKEIYEKDPLDCFSLFWVKQMLP